MDDEKKMEEKEEEKVKDKEKGEEKRKRRRQKTSMKTAPRKKRALVFQPKMTIASLHINSIDSSFLVE